MRTYQQKAMFHLSEVAPHPAAPPRLYQAPVIRLQLARESSTPAPRQIRSPLDIVDALSSRFGNCDREVFVAVLLDTRNKVLAIDPCFVGSLDTAAITMREAFKPAMLVGAAAVIFAHNHPTGDPSASPEDIAMTALLRQAGEILQIDVLDHIILGDGRYTSLREHGLGFGR
jgi:DNA repair protein RadC